MPKAKKPQESLLELNGAKKILNMVGVMILILDRRGKIRFINKEGCKVLEAKKEDIIGRSWIANFIPSEVRKGIRTIFKDLMAGRAKIEPHYVNAVITAKNKKKYISWYNTLLKDKKGEIIGVLSSGTDVTKEKEQQKELAESEKKYSTLVNQASDGILVIEGMKILYANPSLAKIAGVPKSKLVGSSIKKFIPAQEMKRLTENYLKRIAGKSVPSSYKSVLQRGDGRNIKVGINASLITFNGKPADLVIVRDIDDQERIAEALSAKERLLRVTTENVQEAIFAKDRDRKYTFVNQAAVKMIGRPRQEIIGKTAAKIFPASAARIIKKVDDANFQGKSIDKVEEMAAGGKTKLLHTTQNPIKDSRGRVIGIVGVVRDVTRERERTEKLRLMSAAVEQSQEGIAIIDLKGQLIFCNESFAKSHGYRVSEVIGKSVDIFHTDKQLESVQETNQKIKKTGEFTGEIWHQHKTGKIFPALMHNTLIRDESGKPIAILGTLTDITKRKKMADDLAKSEAIYRAAADSSKDCMKLVNKKGEIIFANQAAAKLHNWRSNKQVIGKSIFDIEPEVDYAREKKCLAKAFRGEIITCEYEGVFKNGTKRFIRRIYSPVKNDKGKIKEVLVVCSDVTSYKEAEMELTKAKNRFQEVVDNAQVWVWETNEDGLYTYSSPAVKEILGYSPQSIVGRKHFYDFFPKNKRPKMKKQTLAFFAEKKPFRNFVNENITKKGKRVLLSTSAVPIINEFGKLIGYRGSDHDITVETEARQRLAQSESRLESILESLPDLMFTLNKDLVFTDYNAPYSEKETLYVHPSKFIGKKFGQVFPQEFVRETVPQLKAALKKESCTRFQYDLKIAGQLRTYSASVCPWHDATGNVLGLTVLSRDITARVIAEKDLLKFKKAAEFASNHIVITDAAGKIIFANQAAADNTGYSRQELIGKTPSLWGQQMPREYYKKMWKRIKEEKKPFYGEVKNKQKDGTIYEADITISPILNKNGEAEYFLGIERDITKEKQIDRAKTEFVSLASHELRGPLTAINWYAEMMLDKKAELPDRFRRSLNEIYRGGQRMTRLISALLNVSRIELGTFAINPQPTDLAELSRKVLEGKAMQIDEKNITLKKDIAAFPKVKVDPVLMKTILDNLVDNAIKYNTVGGEIMFTLSKSKDSVIFSVRDTGCGIPKRQQSQIFKKLFRADNASAIDPSGHGLGLYIVKSILETAGGKIWFKSKENSGSTFYVSIPLSGMKTQAGEKGLA